MRLVPVLLLSACAAGPPDYGSFIEESLTIHCERLRRCQPDEFDKYYDGIAQCVTTMIASSDFAGCDNYQRGLAQDCLDEREAAAESCDAEHGETPACDAFRDACSR